MTLVQKGKEYIERNEINEAIDCFDKSIETGDPDGFYLGVLAHKIRMVALREMGMFTGLINDDITAIQRYAAFLLKMAREKRITLSDAMSTELRNAIDEAQYSEAACLFATGNDRETREKIAAILKYVETPDAQCLCGACMIEIEQYKEGYEKLSNAMGNAEYVHSSKGVLSDMIFGTAIHVLSGVYRIGMPGGWAPNLRKAVETLQMGIAAVGDADIKQLLQKELSCYHKTWSGNWKYT